MSPPATLDDDGDERFLRRLGERVRELRTERGVARRTLAGESGLSERYIAQLESGRGNISVLLLRRLAGALQVPLRRLLIDGPQESEDLTHAAELLRRLDPGRLAAARAWLARTIATPSAAERRGRIALIGLRGAGKTTLGSAAAERLGIPFIELDREVERAAGVGLATLFELYGQDGYRRFERTCLESVIREHEQCVLATGGGIVTDPSTFDLLLAQCLVVWLRAAPHEHMERVRAQGDLRPMAGNAEAMADLERILATRDALYQRADVTLSTSGRRVEESLGELLRAVALPASSSSASPGKATRSAD